MNAPNTTLMKQNDLILKVNQTLWTRDKNDFYFTICLNYGSIQEITHAVKEISKEVKKGNLKEEEITPELIDSYLYTNELPKLDLLIRTSGELRISNFLLWQLAYAELYFTNTYWPDFSEKDLLVAIENFQNRKRRFGGLDK